MIDLDYGPICMAGVVLIGFLAPFIYSFFVDDYDKTSPQIRSKNS